VQAARDSAEQLVRTSTAPAAVEKVLLVEPGAGCALLLRRAMLQPSGAVVADVRIARPGQPNGNRLFADYERMDARIVFIPKIENGVVVRWQHACTPRDLFRPVICDAP
jgi:hypothetical protein